MARDLTKLFSPQSIAVVGVSRTPAKVGAIVLKSIIKFGFKGKIYPVNPAVDQIGSLQCYPDLKSLPEVPDLAIVAIPAAAALEILQQAGEKGIKNVLIFAAGFKESGEEGLNLENRLVEIAKRYDIDVLGPNCLGFVNTLCPINATFGDVSGRPGNIRFISQSGAIASSMFDWCKNSNLGFSEFITLGNKAVINENDILEYFLHHKNKPLASSDQQGLSDVFPVGLYLESIVDGRRFIKLVQNLTKTNPVFIIKPGKSHAAVEAMRSHTGAIAGEDAVLDVALKESGAIRCQTLEDFFDLSRAFAWENAPKGPRVAVISNAGGPAVISTDAIVKERLEMAKFDEKTKESLQQVLPRSASVLNPIDVLGDALADRVAGAAEIVLATDQTDALVVILTPQVMTQMAKTAQLIGDLSAKYQKPIFCSFIGGSLVVEGEKILNEYKIPSFRFPERAVTAVGAMWRWKKQQMMQTNLFDISTISLQMDEDRIKNILHKALVDNQTTVDGEAANQLLTASGIATPNTAMIADIKQAIEIANNIGWPVVLKLSAPGLLHKTELDGVITEIANKEELTVAWAKLQISIKKLEALAQKDVKVIIQKDITNGVEVIVGVKRDITFGPVLLFGAGGTLAELIVDRNLQLLPVNIAQAKKLVEQSKIYSILKGYRGGFPYALSRLYELIVRLGKLVGICPEIKEMEINPVIVTRSGTFAVDAKIIIKSQEGPNL